MTIMGVAKFQHLFRSAAGISVDKDDLKRYSDFVHHKLYDLLLISQATARANDRGLIEPSDLPITKGLQESIHRFIRFEEALELQPIISQLATLPPLDLLIGDETRAQLPEVAGGLTVALADTFKIIDPKSKNPDTADWEKAFRIFDLLL